MAGIHTLFTGIANVHLVPLPRGLMVVDTGFSVPGTTGLILSAAHRMGYAPRDVRLILLTHGHVDHAGAAAALRRATGAPIAMHGGDAEMVRRGWHAIPLGRGGFGRPSAWVLHHLPWTTRFESFAPDLWLEEGQQLAEFGVEGYLVQTPGHTSGSISLLLEGGHALIGDALVNWRRVGFPLYWEDPEQARASAVKLAQLKPAWLYTGHGARFRGAELERFLERMETYASSIVRR